MTCSHVCCSSNLKKKIRFGWCIVWKFKVSSLFATSKNVRFSPFYAFLSWWRNGNSIQVTIFIGLTMFYNTMASIATVKMAFLLKFAQVNLFWRFRQYSSEFVTKVVGKMTLTLAPNLLWNTTTIYLLRFHHVYRSIWCSFELLLCSLLSHNLSKID